MITGRSAPTLNTIWNPYAPFPGSAHTPVDWMEWGLCEPGRNSLSPQKAALQERI
jgi:hypothetical protein